MSDRVKRSQARSQTSSEEKDKMRKIDREKRSNSRSHLSAQDRERIKAIDKEKKSQSRAQLTEEEKEEIKKRDRERKAKLRMERKQQKEFEKRKKSEEDRDRQIEKEMERARNSETKQRANRSEEEAEFHRIQQLLLMRTLREARNGKEHLLDNLKAKKGMREFHQNGRVKDLEERSFRDIDEETIWYKFWRIGPRFRSVLQVKKPELAKKLEERQEKDHQEREKMLQQHKDKLREGMWMLNPQTEEYYWTGENPPPEGEYELYNGEDDVERTTDEWGRPLNKERDEREYKEWMDLQSKWYKEEMEARKKEKIAEKNKRQRERYQKIKEELKQRIELPELEKSEYELLRERNIKEREEAMKTSGWFSD